MKLCPKCNSLMIPTETTSGKVRLNCASCGYSPRDAKLELREKINEKPQKIEEISDKKEIIKAKDTMPIVDSECEKCGNDKAYNWEIQTRGTDEPATQFFRCTKCDHTWREYE